MVFTSTTLKLSAFLSDQIALIKNFNITFYDVCFTYPSFVVFQKTKRVLDTSNFRDLDQYCYFVSKSAESYIID